MTRARLALLLAVALGAAPLPAAAQPYARFAVPDSALPAALAAARADFEASWNALLVAEIRATLARADSARRLARLARGVADAERAALGTRIAADALALRRRWNRERLRARVAAASAESLAAAARGRREFDLADSLLLGARDAYRRLGERRREAWVLGSLGANALVAGRNVQAAAYYAEALPARRALGDSLLVGNTLNDLGQTYYQLSRFAEARAALEEARAIREAQRRWAQLGNTLNFLGLTLAALERPDSAIVVLRRSVELTSAQGDSARTLALLKNAAHLMIEHGRLDEAARTSARALSIARTLGAEGDVADIENNLGHLERIAGRYGAAIRHFDQAIAGFAQGGLSSRHALALSRKGVTQVLMGDLEQARGTLEQALAVATSLEDHSVQSRVLSSLALAAIEVDDLTGARRLAEEAIRLASEAADTLGAHDAAALLGYLAQESGDPASAEPWFRRAVAAGVGMRPEIRANDLSALATSLQSLGRLDEAERGHRAALDIAVGSPNQRMWALCNLGDVAERRGDHASAFASYAEALAIADTLRTLQGAERHSIKLFASRLFMFEAMIHLLGKLDPLHPDSGYGRRAFEWAERSRARAFLDLLAAGGAAAARAPILTLEQAQGLLRSDREALLEYSVGDSSSTLWVLRRDRWSRHTLPPRPVLRARAQALRRALADPAASTGAAAARAARALHQMLIAPAEPLLAGIERLIVAPDGPLALIPFEALLADGGAGVARATRAAYLGERFAISYTPSASVLAAGAPAAPDSVIVAVGNPDFGAAADTADAGQALAELPSTADEVAAIRRLAGSRRVAALLGREASRERLLGLPELSRAGVLHIATHGDVNESEPERSGLWLAPDPGAAAPSRIEVADIAGLRIAARLVTLSACETGLGRLENGEGVVGLARAFMAAGARSVVVSLWPVNDRSTARLMERFYRGALDGRGAPDAALAAAKRALLADPETRAPYYWAPFVLVGRAEP